MDDSSLTWDDGALVTIDQRGLPHEVRELRLTTVDQVIDAITTLAIRGAPAIGIAGAFGVVIATRAHTTVVDAATQADDEHGCGAAEQVGQRSAAVSRESVRAGLSGGGVVDVAAVEAEADRIAAARPTAVNLAWAVERVRARIPEGADAVLAETLGMLAEDGRVNLAAATHAADLVQQLCGDRPLRLLTHCNTGRLATSAVGTAIGALRVLHERGAVTDVIVDETRPLLQGARLTAWELAEAGIPHRLTIDSAAAWAMATGQVDAVLVGADRITANGDVANKIGTFGLALAARHHGLPFIVVAPESTRDTAMATGAQIVVEQRAAAEVTGFGGVEAAPAGTAVFNPAFDVTPADLVTAVVTENGVVYRNADTFAGNGRAASSASDMAGRALAAVARQLYERGWMPGTAGNISVRSGSDDALITASGLSKGELTERDAVRVRVADTTAYPGQDRKPSAETSIHTAVYRTRDAGAVVHVHSPFATALATTARPGDTVRVSGYELIKGFGLDDPSTVDVPVFANWPDVARIGADIEYYLRENPGAAPILFITGHGITAWGDTLAQARDRAECLEALCELIARTGRTDATPFEIGPR
ncbi:bifunctional S-methyl-5-thioribose-1-phosphate isomerase/methylthioribulose 1-phosphate dehydratase [Nocardia coubleae]|uniref:Multifunctional fusion protein n=1 Tax=Nocardia coubleae TaxID=356147 RepID=A0A846W4R5_9NOCA|nr:bifunctional S-methyl-5-thioribose-1-phosphate isomerase/methylthioribulose 1-phosphate dehydratase [Nocardia coubleae]NKX88249.1 bifunctional S-methyl-5-thioribose-1-phosphate isomerase/methylthioribulose 1-phosphate dehydratase [Nocardia coubleae]